LQFCGSGLFFPDPDFQFPSIPDPDFLPDLRSRIPDLGSRIPDPKTVTTKGRGEKNMLSSLFCSHKFHKIVNHFMFEMLKKKILANLKKMSLSSQKYRFGIPDPEVKKAPDSGFGSATLSFCNHRMQGTSTIHAYRITCLSFTTLP
jgi:hypothetical protein